jgi:hypothetical protein
LTARSTDGVAEQRHVGGDAARAHACSSCTIHASPPGSETDSTSMPVSAVKSGYTVLKFSSKKPP